MITVAHDSGELTPEELGFSLREQTQREPSASSQSVEAKAQAEAVGENPEHREHREGDDVPMVDDPEDFTEPPVEDRDPDMQFK